MRRAVIALTIIMGGIVAAAAPAASTEPSLPPPGTAAQIAALVRASTSVATLPSPLVPSLRQASGDNATAYYPNSNVDQTGCSTVTACVYGDRSSPTTVVLYGDSHAQMWLTALVPIATKDKFKLVLVWHPGCQIEDFPMANVTCDADRTTDIGYISHLAPALVLLSQKVTEITGPSGKVYTNAQWTTDLEVTIRALQTSTTTVVVVGDTNQFDSLLPGCLAINPTNIQKCAVPNPNPKYTQHFAAEKAAATATHAGYINPIPWMCTAKKCSPVVGTMIVLSDNGHLTATFAEYLTNLWSAALTAYVP